MKAEMKNFKIKRFGWSIIGLIFISNICSSCKNNDEVTPDYVGKWEVDYPYPSTSGGFGKITNTLTLTIETYKSEKYERHPFQNSWVLATTLGSLRIANDSMKTTIGEILISPIDHSKDPIVQPATTYKVGDYQLDLWLLQTNQNKNFSSVYRVFDNKLLMKSDFNLDGDYQDTCETIVYSRVW